MKQYNVKQELRSVISNKKIDPNYSFRQSSSDFGSSKGFKANEKSNLNENHDLNNYITGVKIFSKFNNESQGKMKPKKQASISNTKGETQVFRNIKQSSKSKGENERRRNGFHDKARRNSKEIGQKLGQVDSKDIKEVFSPFINEGHQTIN